MATFPTSLDSFPTILPSDTLDTAGKELDVMINSLSSSIIAAETLLGITGSADSSSHEYKIANMAETLYGLGFPRVLWQSGIPFVLPGGDGGANGLSFTGTRGVFTMSAAINTGVYAALTGCYMYFPAGAGGLSAGWYWTQFTTDTDGEVFNNTYTPGSGTQTFVSSPTQHPNLTAGRITQTTGSITAISFNMLAGVMGPNGIFRGLFKQFGSNDANQKVYLVRWNSTSIWSNGPTTSPCGDAEFIKQNAGKQNYQIGTKHYTLLGQMSGLYSSDQSTVDTSAPITVSVTMQNPSNLSTNILIPRLFTVQYGP